MIFENVKRMFWALRFIFISFGFIVWGMTIDNWEVSNAMGMFGLFIFVGGFGVFVIETSD